VRSGWQFQPLLQLFVAEGIAPLTAFLSNTGLALTDSAVRLFDLEAGTWNASASLLQQRFRTHDRESTNEIRATRTPGVVIR